MKKEGPSSPNPAYTIISEQEACERFQLHEHVLGLYGVGAHYMLYEGDVTIDGTFDTQKHIHLLKNTFGIIITGNLIVSGVIYQPGIDNGEHLLVLGNLTAKSINKGGGEFYIRGNVTVEQTIYGYYNHGRLIIDGDTNAVAIFPDDHYFRFGGQITGTIVNGEDIAGLTTGTHDISALREELIKEEEYPNSNKINNYINAGKHILRDELLPGFPRS